AAITAPASAPHGRTGLVATVPLQPGATYDWSIVNGSITAGQGTNSIVFNAGASGTSTIVSVTVTLGTCSSRDVHNVALTSVQPPCPTGDVPPAITSPARGAVVNSPVTIAWTAIASSSGYRVHVDDAPFIATRSTSLTLPLAAGPHVVVVEALFDTCPSKRSPSVDFTVRAPEDPCTARGPATPVAPANGATVSSSSVTFTWLAANGATGYRLWASRNGAAPSVIGVTNDTSLVATLAPGTFTWYVEALYAGCASTESPRFTFTIPPAPECGTQVPQLITPANGALLVTGSITFQWTPVSGASGYEVWLSLENGTPTLAGATTQTSLTAAVPEGRLQWFVRVLTDRCPPRESARGRFAVDLPESCDRNERPILVEPVAQATVTSPATFTWTAPAGATSFELYTIRGNGAPLLLATTSAPQASNIPLSNGRLRWFVRAHFANGCRPLDSVERDLNVVPLPAACTPLARPVISMPGQISSGVAFLIQWTPSPGATSYELQLASNAAFTDAETIGKGASTQHRIARTNDGAAPIALFARVRARDTRCGDDGIASDWSLPAAVFILPAQTPDEAVLPLSTTTTVTFPLVLGPELAGQTFTAAPKQPWLTVAPSLGLVPAGGITLTVTANTAGLPVGTNLGAVAITLTTPSAGSAAAHGTTTITSGLSLSLVTPVTPTPKSTPPPDALIIPAVAHATGINAEFRS
ncbi:MAG TPA: hypothetical protein VFP80_18880, partial [Thermoanaerobaculia bacterium]|nr:hypothetical protein [Thermoanaerobaculia bacterium]